MASLQLIQVRRLREDGTTWEIPFKAGLNLLIGPQNTSKTRTLRIADFCLGHPQNARDRFSQAMVAEYREFTLEIRINGSAHVLTRRFKASGQQRQIDVDGTIIEASEFSRWIAERLGWGWPPISIPRGLHSATIVNEIPLTFRAAYRHIYRRADSWTELASGEFDYLRRGVIAFLLGIARQVYRGSQVQITQEQQRLEELERRRVELRATLNEAVERAASGFRERGTTSLDSIEQTVREVEDQISAVQTERDELASTLRESPGYDAQQDASVAALHEEIRLLSEEEARLSEIISEQGILIETLRADIQRLERARAATIRFNTVMVTACPQCHQAVSAEDAEEGRCYVCHQSVAHDTRERRLDLEQRLLREELAELDETIQKSEVQLGVIRREKARQTDRRQQLLDRLDRERRELVTPLIRTFERLQRTLGQLEQRRASLLQLVQLRGRVTALVREQQQVSERLDQLQRTSHAQASDRGLIMARTSRLAAWMNTFLDNLSEGGRLGGRVTVDPNTLEFFVGSDVWTNVLGDELKIPFLLAYHYAYLRLSEEEDIPFPRLVILDNPFQQDVGAEVIESALMQFADYCGDRSDTQVIVATQRELPLLVAASRIMFDRRFDPDGEGANEIRE